VRTIRTVVPALCAAVLLGGIPSTASAEAVPAAPACSSAPFTTEVSLNYEGLWTYTFATTWCVEKAKIVWAEVVVSHVEYSETCTWAGRQEEWTRKNPDTGAWTLFDLSAYSCETGGGSATKGITPWAEVTVRPDGSSAEDGKGFE
jgi:hypothetical protein